jgi:hypothetical protein
LRREENKGGISSSATSYTNNAKNSLGIRINRKKKHGKNKNAVEY